MPVSPAPSDAVRAVVVVGSARDGRLAPDIARWLTDQTDRRDDLVTDVVDLVDALLPASLAPDAPQTVALRPRLAAADAFVFVVPEYNRGIPGPLKTLIDSFHVEWEAKPVAFVGYGLGLAGGVRAVEHLRQVFAEFHCVGVKDTVSFPRVLEQYDAEGRFPADVEAAAAAAKVMLDQLVWWGRMLRDAKRLRPYGT